jgi:AAA+ superfamily predicted ATPase
MDSIKPKLEELFEQAVIYPDIEFQERLDKLVGLETQKVRMIKLLGLLVNPTGLNEWVHKYHSNANKVVDIVLRRPPLIILAGDVGSGKTELAYTIGDAVARQEGITITLFPLSLGTRGQGRVGQMTQLISAAFDYTIEKAKKLKNQTSKTRGAVILLVDEADALAQSRENNQMHHEDKAGVNAFIRGIDNLGNGKLPAAVIMCTNRPNSLDPAIKRRAADIFLFKRPNEAERLAVIHDPLVELGLIEKEIEKIVESTGPQNGTEYGFTFSDLMQRLIPTIILDAYPNNAVTGKRAIEIASAMLPTSKFKED